MDKYDIGQLYRYSRGLPDSWGLDSYRTPHQYEDPAKAIQATRKKPILVMSQKLKLFKKTTFFDDLQNIAKQIPACNQYSPREQAVEKQPAKSQSKKGLKDKGLLPQRRSSVDDIIKQKKFVPGVGKYNVEETLEDKLEKVKSLSTKMMPSENHRIDTGLGDLAGWVNVGPGSYNNHYKQFGKSTAITISPQNKNRRTKSMDKLPSVHTYNPLPNYPSFEKLLQLRNSKNSRSKSKLNSSFSKATRFQNPQLGEQVSPGPSNYNIITKWMREPKDKTTSKNVFQTIGYTHSRSIYHA